MPNEDFRRELGHVFDEMTGSPSAALPDRVRSSIEIAPEQRGPFWIAGLAAAVIAAVVIGVLFVSNPLNRQTPAHGPGPVTSPAPSISSSPPPDSTLPAFACGGVGLGSAPHPAVVFIDAVRTGAHQGYDRLTIEFKNAPAGDVELQSQNGTVFTNSPRGDQVTLAGRNGILVTIRGADLHTNYNGSIDINTGYATLVEVRRVQDFEGVVQFGLGVSGAACYRAFLMTSPDRLVIDIKA